MPKVEKKRSAVETYAAKITPQKKLAQAAGPAAGSASASATPPPSPGAEQRAKEEWLSRRAALQARIEAEQAHVLAALDKLKQLKPTAAAGDGVGMLAAKDAESLLAYGELRKYGKENIFPMLEQPNPFIDSSSEDSDSESESAKSTEY